MEKLVQRGIATISAGLAALWITAEWADMTRTPQTSFSANRRPETVIESSSAKIHLECLSELVRKAAPDEGRRLERLLELARQAQKERSGYWERTIGIVIQSAVKESRLPTRCLGNQAGCLVV
jgi:tRNA A37 N6-isopentenylltransferase MiaA